MLHLKTQGLVCTRPVSTLWTLGALRKRSLFICLSNVNPWQEVKDDKGQPYWWNTATNETAWSLPAEYHEHVVRKGWLSFDQILSELIEIYNTDSTGMEFWEVARSRRDTGIFEEEFFIYLSEEAGKSPIDRRETILKVQAKLSNPLLRQPAPFES